MVLMPEPLFAAVEQVTSTEGLPRPLFFLTPGGRPFDQGVAASSQGSRASPSCAGAMRASTSGWATTWSTGSSPSAISSWPAVRPRPSS